MDALVLLDVRELLEGLVTEPARVFAHVRVDEAVLGQLLGRREEFVARGARMQARLTDGQHETRRGIVTAPHRVHVL